MTAYDIRIGSDLAEMLGLDTTGLVSFTLVVRAARLPMVRATYLCDAQRVTKRYRLTATEFVLPPPEERQAA